MAGHLTDVASTDQHTLIKPWFNGKLAFAPHVMRISPQKDFALIGGLPRLCIADTEVAALVYQRRKHVINVFTWPSNEADSAPGPSSRRGYNVLHWTQKGMTYWAVSDLNIAELAELQTLIEGNDKREHY